MILFCFRKCTHEKSFASYDEIKRDFLHFVCLSHSYETKIQKCMFRHIVYSNDNFYFSHIKIHTYKKYEVKLCLNLKFLVRLKVFNDSQLLCYSTRYFDQLYLRVETGGSHDQLKSTNYFWRDFNSQFTWEISMANESIILIKSIEILVYFNSKIVQ